MAPRILGAAQMQWADQRTIAAGHSGETLMEAAGAAVARAVAERSDAGQRIWIAAGPGNNGGDGLAAARALHTAGRSVCVSLLGGLEHLRGAAATHAEKAVQAGVCIEPVRDAGELEVAKQRASEAQLIVDALFGTGLSRPLTGLAGAMVALINASDRSVLAVDVASGTGDDGIIHGTAVRARWTLPIAACKWGSWLGSGREHAGTVLEPARIGIGEDVLDAAVAAVPASVGMAQLIDSALIRRAFPPRPRAAHKNSFGHLWVLGGSLGYTGAPRLVAMGGFAVGSGLVSIACPQDVYAVIAASCLEAMVHPEVSAPWHGADAVVAGPGWGAGGDLEAVIDAGMPLVLDAGGLNMLAEDADMIVRLKARQAPTVITPHPGEAARLLDTDTATVQGNRLAAALQLTERFGCWVVLKGADSLVVSPHRQLWLCPYGSPRLAVAGTGDVLAGMIGGLLAQGRTFKEAVPAAVALHALAGESGGWHLAGELSARIVAIIERGVF